MLFTSSVCHNLDKTARATGFTFQDFSFVFTNVLETA